MSAQELLTFLFDAIALGFIVILAIDLSREIIALYNQTFIAPQKSILLTSQLQALPQLPDPWLLPAVEALGSAKPTQVQAKPVLLLAPASSGEKMRSPLSKATIEELLGGIDIDTLKLRQARKLAKALGIAQKVNGKDQKLDWLKGQIQAKLQQETSLLPEVRAVSRGELVAC